MQASPPSPRRWRAGRWHLTTLELYGNAIGDEGMSALAKAITPDKDGRGALASLTTLDLHRNAISDDGMKALADACASGALPQLKQARTDRNQIGDVGMQALAGAVSKGALVCDLCVLITTRPQRLARRPCVMLLRHVASG